MSNMRQINPTASPVDAVVRPPGSKSETIRALFTAALASGSSRLHDPLVSDDTGFARSCLRELGVGIDDRGSIWEVVGSGGVLRAGAVSLDAGASGLTARSLIALAPLVEGTTTIVGRERLPERPMQGLVDALRQLGVEATATGGRLPVMILGTGTLPGGTAQVASQETTQFVTGLLLAAPLAEGTLTIVPVGLVGSHGSVEMTLRMMGEFGAVVDSTGSGFRVAPTGYVGREVDIEPDASAAVYPMVAAAVTGGRVTIEGLGSDSLQPDMEVADVLEAMGCTVVRDEDTTTVTGGPLNAIDVDLSGSPDGALAVAVACLFASGQSRLAGLGSLRYKESDRLVALASEIRRLGALATVDGDALLITPARLGPARIETHGDHRIAMSLGLVGLVQPGIVISDPGVVDKTWPGYWAMLDQLVAKRG
jgi:3-phosphoshikimate 1-carboxyvinyltransferase